jgi:hypothetical protein
MGISATAGLHIRVTAGNRGITVSRRSHDDSGNISSTSPKESSFMLFFIPKQAELDNISNFLTVAFYATAYLVSSQGELKSTINMFFLDGNPLNLL